MGMLIDGQWVDDADRSMQNGTYRREASALPSRIDAAALARDPARYILVASASCPWSHGAVLTAVLKGFAASLPLHWAGGPRVQGYGLLPGGPLDPVRHLHQLYAATDPLYTGRATVPVFWDSETQRILSNASGDIMQALNTAGDGPDLYPMARRDDIDTLTAQIFEGLSNAVYRAGKSERQDEYDNAVDTVFATMDLLEHRLSDQPFLFGDALTLADVRLFASLVRFDTVYATHFRCTRKRLVDCPALWRFTRRVFQMPGIRDTVDFGEIRRGYYINDGSHNPHGIVGQQPQIDWDDATGL